MPGGFLVTISLCDNIFIKSLISPGEIKNSSPRNLILYIVFGAGKARPICILPTFFSLGNGSDAFVFSSSSSFIG